MKGVLTSASARKTDFHMGLMHVDAAGLLAIRGLIATKVVRVAVVPVSSSDVAAHDIYGAGYYHARGGSRFMTESENEAAAYAADALYHFYETGRTQGSAIDPIFVKAGAIARRIANLRGAHVSTDGATDLRTAIVNSHVYEIGFGTPTGADGL
ncbi:MAG: hypothetical protein AB7O88_23400 [Reyranellaceae bacterium]